VLDENDTLYFLHIPKTAGTTLISILDDLYDNDQICPAQLWHEFVKIPPEQLLKYRLLRGHLGYCVYQFLPKKPIYITLLRDPVERAISHYEHIRRGTRHYLHHKFMTENITLADFINNPEINPLITNFQTRNIAFDLDIKSIIRSLSFSQLQDLTLQSIVELSPITISQSDLIEIAKERLSHFAFVGLVERLEECLPLLSYTFRWRPIASRHLNVTPNRIRREEIPQPLIERIIELNQLDIELYQYAEQLVNQSLMSMREALGSRSYEQYFLEGLTPMSSVELTFDQAMWGSGWHQRELDTLSGLPFRWTGPSPTSTLNFYLEAESDYALEFRVIRAISPELLDNLSVQVNGKAIDLTRVSDGGHGAIYRGLIPSEHLQKQNLTQLAFQVSETVAPQSLEPGSRDDRPLGIAFNWLRISPLRVESTREGFVTMPNERIVEIPWALMQLPQSGIILDIGSCESVYLRSIPQPDRILHCLDPRDCSSEIPAEAVFHQQSIIGNDLPRAYFDAVLVLSTLEHIGLPHYGQKPFEEGDKLALAEIAELLKPGCPAILTLPVGRSKLTWWYRQYSPADLRQLFTHWEIEVVYWGYKDGNYVPISEEEVELYDYDYGHGAKAVAGVIAHLASHP
jgi:hypothetical protein